MGNEEYAWIHMVALLCLCDRSASQLSYSISEEANKGTVVGNIAKDLNLNVHDLEHRDLRIVSSYSKKYFDVNLRTGNLFVDERIDREEICPHAAQCFLRIQAVLSNPMNAHRIEVSVLDINDNSPEFIEQTYWLNISESLSAGERYFLPIAVDADIGSNSVKNYKLNRNDHFSLDVQSGGEHVKEDAELGTIVAFLTVSDKDGGNNGVANCQVEGSVPFKLKSNYKNDYSLVVDGPLDRENTSLYNVTIIATDGIFDLNSESGEITVKGTLNYEETPAYEVRVQAVDQGTSPRSAHAKLLIEIIDVNDNAPEISVTSLMTPVKEDAELGTIVAFLTVSDKDGGNNGVANCQVEGSVPFKLKSNYKNDYSLVVDGPLDRENTSLYNVTIIATDGGNPPLSSIRVITVHVSDVNDNAPRFMEPVINVYIKENSPAGSIIYTINASDPDMDDNANSVVAGAGFAFSSANTVHERAVLNFACEHREPISISEIIKCEFQTGCGCNSQKAHRQCLIDTLLGEVDSVTSISGGGYYDDLYQLQDELNSHPRELRTDVSFKYSNIKKRFDYAETSNCKIRFYMLGMKPFEWFQIKANSAPNSAPYPADIKAGHYQLYCYSDIVRHQLVGDAYAPLLRTVPIQGKFGNIITQSFSPAYYLPVAKKHVENIHIEIKTDQNQPVHFTYGKCNVSCISDRCRQDDTSRPSSFRELL
ncbi:hypothetical protein F2P81_007581 [Scophthalmus maximus]|uniref:Cadherin domain-containing protein n=1 Tax=Scophthalmus maximus TaxID=52904 RepID=A0A6A4SVS8_SCOMX|nr:hypothetical protein F2P81_007581 [Scophthalmus maximus]